MEGGGSSEQDEGDLKRKADEERELKGKAKIEESDDVPAAPTPEIRSFIDNDHHYLKIIVQTYGDDVILLDVLSHE
nr:hypothetical protein CTI12_AA236880 [Tanacetum cinerariifolium]